MPELERAVRYEARRNSRGVELWRLRSGRWSRVGLAASLAVWNHSPSGFEWGYAGSGPAQLALAILLDWTGDAEVARLFHQRFKFARIARWDRDEMFYVWGSDIDRFLTEARLDEMQGPAGGGA